MTDDHTKNNPEAVLPSRKEIYSTMIRVAWPAALEAVLVAMVTVIDTIMVGTLGTNAIAAVGITNQPRSLLLVVFFALNVSITAIVSRRKGEQRQDAANRCLRQSILLAGAGCFLLSLLGSHFARELITFMGAEEAIVADAVRYYRIILLGLPLTTVSLAINAAQRGVGNTRISMRTNLTANLLNMVFNYLLIGGHFGFPALGVTGAAIATNIGYLAAFLMSFHSLRNPKGFLYLRWGQSFLPDRETLSALAHVGGSAVVEQVFMRIGFMTFVKVVATLGTASFTTYQICMNIMTVSCSYGDGLGIAAASLVGQNLGRKRPDIASLYGRAGQNLALLGSVFITSLFLLFPNAIIGLFTSDPEVLEYGRQVLVILAIMTPPQMVQFMYAGCLRGAGDTRFVALASLLSTTLVRPILGWICCFPLNLGVVGAWIGILGDQLARLTATYLRFRTGRWQKIKV